MSAIIILNPQAGNGRAGTYEQEIKSLLKNVEMDAKLWITPSADAVIEMAQEAACQAEIVVAAGGDGTIHQVANGIIKSKRPVSLGIIPKGTGNDFVKMLGIPSDLKSTLKILAKGKRKAVDYGTVHFSAHSGDGLRFFVNSMGVGFDAEVGHRASSFKVLPGFLAYLAALLGTLRSLNNSNVQIIIDGNFDNLFYQGTFLLCSVGNGTTSGGMFKLTPGAEVDDGLLDVCAIEQISISRLLMSVPSVLRGTHVGMKEYYAARAKKIVIKVDAGATVHTDGEILAQDINQLEIEIVEKGISVIVP